MPSDGPGTVGSLRILVVSQMYPGPSDPDLGVFVAQLVEALRERGHELELAVLDHRSGGKRRYLELRRTARAAARPDVVWAHFLVPSGLIATGLDAPLVVTAHGRDVRNIGAIPGVAALTRRVVERASTVIAVSDYLRRELELKLPEARGKTEVVDSGVDVARFAAAVPVVALESPAFVAVGGLTERKNPVRLAEAFATLRPRQPDLRRRGAATAAARRQGASVRRGSRSARGGSGLPRRG